MPEMTYQEIADQLGISKQRVYKLEKNALKKMLERCPEFGLTPEVLDIYTGNEDICDTSA